MKKAYIFCNNKCIDYTIDFAIDGLIIAADGGAEFLVSQKIYPQVLIGDFDSISNKTLRILKEKSKILQYPTVKNETDSELALDYCIENNYDTVVMINAQNGRLDHTLANIFLIEKFIKNGISLSFINRDNKIFVLHDYDEIEFKSQRKKKISLIPLTERVHVESISGFEYKLENKILYRSNTQGISNNAISEVLNVKISSGILLIICGR